MKDSIDTIGNVTRDLHVCSEVPQLRYRVPSMQIPGEGKGNAVLMNSIRASGGLDVHFH